MTRLRTKAHTAKKRAIEVVGLTNTPEETAGRQEPHVDEATAALAYELWIQRGCPIGTPEVDWFRAEEEQKKRIVLTAAAAGGK